MKITAIHVDGYGTLAGLDLDGLSPTLSVVYGRNEAGKSTLLDFVRAVLFGIPDRRSRQNRREPLRGGRHGGTLRLLDADGRPWILERHSDSREPVLTGPDGHLGGEAELHALLGGANAGLFRSIFAFGLDELTSLETLDDDDVRDLVFTAGVLGAGRSATRAMRELESRRATIVRPRADAAANDLRHRLDAVDSSLRSDARRGRELRLGPGRVPPASRRDPIRPTVTRGTASPGHRNRPPAEVLAVLEPDPRWRVPAHRPRPAGRGRDTASRARPRDPAPRRRSFGPRPPARLPPTATGRSRRDRAIGR